MAGDQAGVEEICGPRELPAHLPRLPWSDGAMCPCITWPLLTGTRRTIHGDHRAGDGVFTATMDISKVAPGLMQVRFVSRSEHNKLNIGREATASAHIPPR